MSRKTRKLIWSAPLVAVLAVAGALAIFAAQMPGTALAHDPPGVVGNLTASAEGTTQIDLSWDAPTEGGMPTGYRIDRSKDGNAWTSLAMDHTMRTYSDMELKPDTDYYYRVFAVNAAGTGPVSQDFQIQTDMVEMPGQVIGLRATAMGQNQVDLSWTAPSNDGGAPITQYSIHWATGDVALPVQDGTIADADNSGVIVRDVADGTSYEHKKLTHTTRYKYVVYAHNMDGGKATAESDLAAATTAPLETPSNPTGVTAVQTAARTFSLYWYAPADNGGTDPVNYAVQAQYNGRGSYLDITTTWRTPAGTSEDTTFDVPDNVPDSDPADPITSVRFRVYAITRADDTGTVGVDEELKSRASSSSARMTIRTDEWRAENLPDAPTFAPATAIRTPKGNVNLSWTAPPIDSSDETDNNDPDSIGGYRIDVSNDGVHWRALTNHTRKTATEYQYVDPENKNRHYRIFAWHAQYLGPAHANSVESSLRTEAVTPPGHVKSFTATAVSSAQIDLSWSVPTNDGNADIVLYRIDAVRAAADGTFADFAAVESPADDLPTAASPQTDGVLLVTTKTPGYMHKGLNAGETWKYRVLAVTDDESETGNIRTATATTAETRTAMTPQASLPEAPEGLVAEDAKDSSLTGSGDRGVLLLWNAPNPPDGAEITGYRIQRKKDDAAWETLETDTASLDTNFTDTSEPAAGELRAYRVAALNGTKLGAYSNMAYYPHALAQPGKPTLTAAKDADMPGTKVKLTWTAPDMNADLVTGYIIERRHAGDMMGDIPSDGYNDGVMGRSHAFMDYKEWWETLNCKGMLAVAGSSASVTATEGESAQHTADRDMYCKHFANTAPTNMAFEGKTVPEETAMKIKEMFMKRYVTDDMGKTMTIFTGMTYTDMGLMANTEYTYRVRAIHGMKAGMWSDKAMVTTGTDNTDPMKVGTIAAVTVEVGETSDPMDVSVYFSDTDDDTLTYTAMSIADMTATADIPAGSSMLTITGVAEGRATITVTASDGKGGTDAMQTIAVTVEAADTTLGAPSDIGVTVDDQDPASINVNVTWTNGANAVGHIVFLFDTSDYSLAKPAATAQTDGETSFPNVSAGSYIVVVVAYDADANVQLTISGVTSIGGG